MSKGKRPPREQFELFLKERAYNSDELSRFWNFPLWMKKDTKTRRYVRFLSTHGRPYFSILRPVFLRQLRNLNALDGFSLLLSRDGFYSLLRFFHEHPYPPAGKGLLLVHRSLADLVPERWLDSVAYYDHSPTREGTDVQDLYLILTAIDEHQCSEAYLEKQLKPLRDQNHGHGRTIHLLPFLNPMFRNTESTIDLKSVAYARLLEKIWTSLGSPPRTTGWADVQQSRLQNSAFLDLNEFGFYYRDSFVVQHFLSRGSRALARAADTSPDHSLDLSFHHRANIWFQPPPGTEERRKLVSEAVKDYRGNPLYREEEKAFRSMPSFRDHSKISPRSFERMAFHLARELGDRR